MAFYTRLFSGVAADVRPVEAADGGVRPHSGWFHCRWRPATWRQLGGDCGRSPRQASLVLNLGRFLSICPSSRLCGHGRQPHRGMPRRALTTTLQQVQTMAFSAALPAMAAQLGKVVRVNAGPAYACDNWWALQCC